MIFPASVSLGALLLFTLRVVNMALQTWRLVLVMCGRQLLAALIGSCEALIFVVMRGTVLRDLNNV